MQGNGREETAMIDLVVRGDTVVTPQGVGAYDIAIEGERIVPRQQRCLRMNRLQVFKRAHTARLALVEGPEQRTRLVPSEKCAASWGSEDAEMRMITASFVRVLQRYTDSLHTHYLLIFQ
jgi:hypothetical protein